MATSVKPASWSIASSSSADKIGSRSAIVAADAHAWPTSMDSLANATDRASHRSTLPRFGALWWATTRRADGFTRRRSACNVQCGYGCGDRLVREHILASFTQPRAYVKSKGSGTCGGLRSGSR